MIAGDITEETGFDLDKIAGGLRDTIDEICGTDGTAADAGQFGAVSFDGDNSNLQFFTVKSSDLKSANFIKFSVRNKNAAVVVLVQGSGKVELSNLGIDIGGLSADRILWVFCSGKKVTMSRVQVQGSILTAGPLHISDANVKGTVVAESLTAERSNFQAAPFCVWSHATQFWLRWPGPTWFLCASSLHTCP